ncbi:MAG TPA: site-specific DNA-methyltransferase [Pirellulaceae bacterium]|nr:site-specific DNA-methyltransferase [Pirellulaceae bacterium]
MSVLRCEFLLGDAAQIVRDLAPESVDTVVTSPPYYRQRDYGTDAQIGNESTPHEYVARLVEVFSALRRALKPAGSVWVVLGDKFDRGQMLGMPWRFALAMQDQGWLLRADCIWHKPNAMPSAATNRPTIDHEYVFLLTNSADYYYNADAIREPHVTFSKHSRMKGGRKHFGVRGGTPEQGKNAGSSNLHDGRWDQAFHPLGRNKRTVWSIPLSKYRGAHFAVFPEKLVETCVLATCPSGGTVLDPFAGAGTTALVARRLQRHAISIDCNADYLALAQRRVLAIPELAGIMKSE